LAALILYAITLGGSYVYDDTILHEDPRFTHPALWWKFWTDQYMPGAVDRLYRPLTCMTFAVQYSLHGDRPWLYHLVNWLLHAGVAAAVAELARRLMGFRVALVAGILFAIHPVHVEAVAGLVGRAELLCALASLIALILFLKPMTAWRGSSICVCLVVAILSKEQGILLPGFLLALLPFRKSLLASQLSNIHSTSNNREGEKRAMGGMFAGLCLITAAYIAFREQLLGFGWDRQSLDWTANPLILSTGSDRVLMPLVLLGRYLCLLIAPVKLSLDYGTHVIGWTVNWRQPYVYLGATTLLVGLVALALTIRRRNWAAVFCLLALGLSYAMVSNFVILIGTIFGERLMYLPSAFFLILVAALLCRWLQPTLLTFVMLMLVALGSIRTFTYARLWNDPLQLYLADLHDHPGSMHLHGLAVDQYLAQGNYKAARAVAEDSRRVLPECVESYRMCVAADIKMHDFADADAVLAHPDRRCSGLRISELREGVQRERMKYEQERRAGR
jgi:hypothetical protein